MIGIHLAKNFSFWHLQISGSRKLQLVKVDNISLISDWQVLPLSVKCYCIISLLPLRKKGTMRKWKAENEISIQFYESSFIYLCKLPRVIEWAGRLHIFFQINKYVWKNRKILVSEHALYYLWSMTILYVQILI